ncbi:unnamed protein product [Prorocentrum cordatum]|uniref:Uncharacterized protein n=1 Tax=Prorocentrum cordatum TaxID=2364126 RepID=A0ABN9U7J4_9DINO|nr:unnamed protein product [Polarella glacialis]
MADVGFGRVLLDGPYGLCRFELALPALLNSRWTLAALRLAETLRRLVRGYEARLDPQGVVQSDYDCRQLPGATVNWDERHPGIRGAAAGWEDRVWWQQHDDEVCVGVTVRQQARGRVPDGLRRDADGEAQNGADDEERGVCPVRLRYRRDLRPPGAL